MHVNEIIKIIQNIGEIEIIQRALKAVPWLFSGIGLLIGEYIYKKYRRIDKKNTKVNLNQSEINYLIERQYIYQPETPKIEEIYEVGLGKRLIRLREVLGFNQNQMRKVLGYTKVAELRKYEEGKDEFPQKSIDKLEKIFYINRSFLEDGDTNRIFQIFDFDVYPQKIKELLKDNFELNFLCSPRNRERLYTYPVFFKKEGYYASILQSKPSSFMSNGGGKQYIELFIKEMLHKEMNYWDASVLSVNQHGNS